MKKKNEKEFKIFATLNIKHKKIKINKAFFRQKNLL